jgi:muconolactone delta-isomerase
MVTTLQEKQIQAQNLQERGLLRRAWRCGTK